MFRADAVLQAIEKTREVLVTPSPANSVSTLGRIAIHTPASRPTHDGPDRPPFEPYVVQPYTLLGSRLVGRGEELDALTDWFREGTSPAGSARPRFCGNGSTPDRQSRTTGRCGGVSTRATYDSTTW